MRFWFSLDDENSTFNFLTLAYKCSSKINYVVNEFGDGVFRIFISLSGVNRKEIKINRIKINLRTNKIK